MTQPIEIGVGGPCPSSCEAMRRHSGYDRAEWQAVSGRSLWKPTVFKKLPRSTT